MFTNLFSFYGPHGPVWSMQANMDVVTNSLGVVGYSFQAFAFGGNPASGGYTTNAYFFNGTTWNGYSTMPVAVSSMSSLGDLTQAICAGGARSDIVQYTNTIYTFINTLGWSNIGSLIASRQAGASAGVINNFITFGGTNGAALLSNEVWNGTSSSNIGSLNTAVYQMAGVGTRSAALCIGGIGGGSAVQTYNGTTWSIGSYLNTGRYANAACGSQSSALTFGGESFPDILYSTEKWNGVTWKIVSPLNYNRSYLAGCGNATKALAVNGSGPINIAATELYS